MHGGQIRNRRLYCQRPRPVPKAVFRAGRGGQWAHYFVALVRESKGDHRGGGADGQATASGAGKQQLLHDRTTPIDIAQITVASAQAEKLKAEADNLKADKVVKEQEILKLGEEAEKAKQQTVKIKGEVALQGWAQHRIVTGKQIGRAHV